MPTYIYLTHGSECIIEGAPDRSKAVPDKSILATIVESGIESRRSDINKLIRLSTAQSTRELLSKPIENREILSIIFAGLGKNILASFENYQQILKKSGDFEHFRIGHEHFHLKVPGMPYSERKIFFLDHDSITEEGTTLYRSGLYDIEALNYTPLTTKTEVKVSKDIKNLSIPEFLTIYEGSVYPTQEQLAEYIYKIYGDDKLSLTDIADILDNFEITQSKLLELFPGNHYNFSCRSHIDENVNESKVIKTRRNSINITNSLGHMVNFDKRMQNFIKQKKRELNRANTNLSFFETRLKLFLNPESSMTPKKIEIINKGISTLLKSIEEGKKMNDLFENVPAFLKLLDIAVARGLVSENDAKIIHTSSKGGGRARTRRRSKRSRRRGRA